MSFEATYTAAHAEFPDTEPLGGGKAVADYLIREWRESKPFALSVLSPESLGFFAGDVGGLRSVEADLPRSRWSATLQKSLAQMTELEYARFCRQFEQAATAEILRHDPRECVVLCNDISEGPDFAALGELGYRIVTIFHVDVVEYFTKFYLHGLVKTETAAKFRRFSLLPDVLRLVFQKQYECVRHSTRLVVPSAPMRETILRCYPWCRSEKITVVPWGNISAAPHPDPLPRGADALGGEGTPQAAPKLAPWQTGATRYQGKGLIIADDEFVILTISRLSPEKGIDRLLVSLRDVQPNERKVRVFICGAPAYMKGQRYARKLRRLAVRLTNVQVEFWAHVTGADKAALLQRADLFVSPSRYESYGLTIAEAEAAGCRILSHTHYGARGHVVDCADRRALAQALANEIIMGRTRYFAAQHRLHASLQKPSSSDAAQRLAELLVEVAGTPIP